jgi:hypothetical protein
MTQRPLFEAAELDLASAQVEDSSEYNPKPFALLKHTAADVTRVWSFSALLAMLGLFAMRVLYGNHPQGEEIIVLATPLGVVFIVFRLFRIITAPLPDQDTFKPTAHDLIAGGFGLGLFFLMLEIVSGAIFLYFGIPWAVLICKTWAKFTCYVLISISAAALMTSRGGREQTKRCIRFLMAVPAKMRAKVESLVSTRHFPRLRLRRS